MQAIKLKINNSESPSPQTAPQISQTLQTPQTPIKLKVNKPNEQKLSLKVDKPVDKIETQLMTQSNYSRFKDQRDHVYNIPDTYIGNSVQSDREERILDLETLLFKKNIIRIPEGVERLFIEILSNAGDNSARSLLKGVDPDEILITMNENTIKIRNGGIPIPVEMHKEEKLYVPELIFGNLMSSSSYDKTKKRQFSSRNGFGSKLTNIFSKKFSVTVADSYNGLLYTKTWTDNMKNQFPHQIVEYSKKNKSFVEIEFTMDFERFGYKCYPKEAFELYARHAVDTAFTVKIPVSFNGVKFNISSAKEYAKLYLGKDAVKSSILYYMWPEGTETIVKKNVEYAKNKGVLPLIEICAVDSPDTAEKVSFVNNILTRNGGVHYEAAFKAVTSGILKTVNEGNSKKKNDKILKLTLTDVKKHVSIFVNCWIEDPIFDSQSKNELKAPTPKINIDEKILKPIMNWELIARLYAELEAKQFRAASKTDGKKKRFLTGMNKLEDANKAGTNESTNCTLYVTEGDSAQTFASKLLSCIPGGKGRDYIGTYPLRGKMLNVMNAPFIQINENREINELKKVLGLREGVNYMIDDNYETLRYGHLMLCCDADNDGYHIAGLIINLFHCKYPSLLARGYVKYLRTKILEVRKNSEKIKFYTHQQYDEWKNATPNYRDWKHKYYKGLATSVDADIQEEAKDPKIVMTTYDQLAPYSIRLAFDQALSNNRKEWIKLYKPNLSSELVRMQPISDFINHDLIQYSIENISRSLPRFTDGLKVSQRKIMWAVIKKWGSKAGNQADPFKVAQLASYVADKMQYCHGEQSLSGAIIGMAQDFVGANNIPLLNPDGEHGSRNKNGADNGASRYIFTRPFALSPFIFRKEDFPILDILIEDGEEVEPIVLLPILPLQLINGQLGVASAFSTYICNYNPLDLVFWIESKIKNIPNKKLIPWYRGFEGKIEIKENMRNNRKGFVSEGTVVKNSSSESKEYKEEKDRDDDEDEDDDQDEVNIDKHTHIAMVTTGVFEEDGKKIVVSEIPIGRSIHRYKEYLDKMRENKIITKYDNYSTPNKPNFIVYGMKNPSVKALKLVKTYGLSNMILIDNNNKPVKYETVEDIMETFYSIRLGYYQKRKDYIIRTIAENIGILNMKIKFILSIIKGYEMIKVNSKITDNEANNNGAILVVNRTKKDIAFQMEKLGFENELLKKVTYYNSTQEEVQSLQDDIVKLEADRKIKEETSPEQMWLNDLEDFTKAYCKHYKCTYESPKKVQLKLVQ